MSPANDHVLVRYRPSDRETIACIQTLLAAADGPQRRRRLSELTGFDCADDLHLRTLDNFITYEIEVLKGGFATRNRQQFASIGLVQAAINQVLRPNKEYRDRCVLEGYPEITAECVIRDMPERFVKSPAAILKARTYMRNIGK